MNTTTTRFPLGNIYMTRGIAALIEKDAGLMVSLAKLLTRHGSGDWGEVDEEDKEANDMAIRDGERILSAYSLLGSRVWIITEADRSSSTILLPSEY